MGSFSRAFGLSEVQVPRPFGKGKTFFVHKFLADVLFAESGLVGVDKKLERRLAVTHSLGYATAAVVAVVLGLLWLSAFTQSSSEAGTLSVQAGQLQELRGRAPPSAVADALPALDKARAIGQFYDQQGFLTNWVQRVGLSSAAVLAAPARAIYRRSLTIDLLPLVVKRLESQLAKMAASSATNQQLHDQLKLYLMLGEPAHFDKSAMQAWMRADAAAVFPLDGAKRAGLLAHYQALLDLMPIQTGINRDLVAGVRQLLVRIPQADAIYDILRKDAANNPALPAFSFARIVGNAADIAFADPSSAGLRTQVPGFYTREGFYNGLVARLPKVVSDQMQSDWVLGQENGSPGVAAAEDVIRHVSDLYVRDYEAVWQDAISHITLTRWNSFDGLSAVLQVLMGPDKPLERILEAVRTNTDLPRDRSSAPAAAQPAGQQPAANKSLTETISSVLTTTATNAQADAAGLVFPDPWPGDQIRTPFQPLIGLVGGAAGQQQAPQQQAPIIKITDEIGAVYAVITKIQQNQDPGEAAYQLVAAQRSNQATDAAAVLRNDAITRPPPVREIMLRIAGAASATIAGGAQDRVLVIWRTSVLPSCLALVSNHYPFDRAAKDEAALSDFTDFFKPGGTVDQFEKAFMPDKAVQTVSTAAAVPHTSLPASLLAQLDIADRIRAAFFGGKGSELAVKFGLQATFLDPRLAAAVINIDDQPLIYRHDPPRTIDFQWPSQSTSGTAKLSLRDFSTDATIFEEQGPWAVFRLFDDLGLRTTARVNAYSLEAKRNELKASFSLTTNASNNAFDLTTLRQFKCLSSF
jgi:type VI secretion system protein ImpL